MLTTAELVEAQSPLLGIRANFVCNQNAEWVGPNNSSRDLTNQTDTALLIKLRSLADLVITDSATASSESYKPSRYAPIEVWSRSGNFRGLQEIAPSSNELGITLIKTTDASARLRGLQSKRIVLETGPTLTAIFGKSELVDQLKLTVVGAANAADAESAAVKARKKLALDYLGQQTSDRVDSSFFFTFSR